MGVSLRHHYGPNAQNTIHSHLPWAQAKGEQNGLESHKERLRFVILGTDLKGQHPGIGGESLYHTTCLSWVAYCPPYGTSLGKSNSFTFCTHFHPTLWRLIPANESVA